MIQPAKAELRMQEDNQRFDYQIKFGYIKLSLITINVS